MRILIILWHSACATNWNLQIQKLHSSCILLFYKKKKICELFSPYAVTVFIICALNCLYIHTLCIVLSSMSILTVVAANEYKICAQITYFVLYFN